MSESNTDAPGTARTFQVRWVFGGINEVLRGKIVSFWLREGALNNPDEAWRRAWEVACILEDASSGDVAGICTVAIGLDEQQRSYGFVRIYVGAGNRHAGLNVRVMRRMIEGFEALATEPGAPQRLLATIENRKLEQRGGLRLLNGVGFHVLGRTPQGELLIERKLSS